MRIRLQQAHLTQPGAGVAEHAQQIDAEALRELGARDPIVEAADPSVRKSRMRVSRSGVSSSTHAARPVVVTESM